MNYAELYMRCFQNRTFDFENTQYFLSRFSKGDKVVELGAGTGRNAIRVGNLDLTLIESSEDMLRILKREIGKGSRHSVVKRDRFRLPLEDESVDGLFMSANTLGEMIPVTFTLSEISRVLAPKGSIQIVNENPVDLIRRRPGYIQAVPDYPEDTYQLATRKCDLFGPFGFETIFQYQGSTFFRVGISQVLPNYSEIKRAIRMANLRIAEGYGDFKRTVNASAASQFFNLICERNAASAHPIRYVGLNKFYEKMAVDYDRVAQNGQYQVPAVLEKMMQDQMRQKLRVLDLGCANGYLGKNLKQRGFNWDFYGVDFSQEMVAQCQRSGDYESVLKADLNFGIPVIEHECFDLALALGVSEFIESPKDFLADIYRILHKGGTAVVSFEQTARGSLKSGKVQANGVVKFHHKKGPLIKVIEAVGFTVEQFESFDGYLSPTLKKWIPYYLVRLKKR